MLRLTNDMLTDIPRIDDAHGNIVEQAHKVLIAFKKRTRPVCSPRLNSLLRNLSRRSFS